MEKVTVATGQALRKVFNILEHNFDAVKGIYLNDYSDIRVAKETGISENAVKDYRTSAFGKLRPPTELEVLKQQCNDLETLYLKMDSEFRNTLKDIRQRMLQLQRKYD